MLEFASGNSSQVNSAAAMRECLEKAVGGDGAGVDVLLIHATIGHNFNELLTAAREAYPKASIVGCTGSGVIHSEGVTEAMRALAVMTISGPEVAVGFRDGLNRANGRDLAAAAAAELRDALDGVNAVALFTASFDVTGDEIIAGIEDVFGPDVPIFGGAAADNGKAKGSFQFHDNAVSEHSLFLIGMADDSLEYAWVSHHGSNPIGEPFEVTASDGGHVIELDGQPAWGQVMARLGLPADTTTDQTLPIAGMGIELPDGEQVDYDNSHMLRVPLETDGDGGFYLPTTVPVGTRLNLMQRDEDKIFAGVERMMERLNDKVAGREIVAVLQADCMARGRLTFDRVLKDEIIAKMQVPLVGDNPVPWLGVYGYSEYCPIGGRNEFHSYTTSLFPVLRRQSAG